MCAKSENVYFIDLLLSMCFFGKVDKHKMAHQLYDNLSKGDPGGNDRQPFRYIMYILEEVS